MVVRKEALSACCQHQRNPKGCKSHLGAVWLLKSKVCTGQGEIVRYGGWRPFTEAVSVGFSDSKKVSRL
jgi:hypothetical protein